MGSKESEGPAVLKTASGEELKGWAFSRGPS